MIRPMNKKDISYIVCDEEKIFGKSLGYDMLEGELKNEMAHYFVLEEDEQLIGYIGTWLDLNNASILNFYIKKEYENKGYGSKLLNYSITYLENLGANLISLEVRESNTKARKLYEKFGFEFSYKRKFYYDNGEDAYVYIKRKV